MGCCDQPGLMPLSEGLSKLLQLVEQTQLTETAALADSAGRVLSTAVIAPFPSPNFNNSAMDGFAVRCEDIVVGEKMPVQGTAFAGKPYMSPIEPGKAIRIMTGAAMPEGADTVIMQEMAEYDEREVAFTKQPKAGSNVRKIGDDFHSGDLLVKENTLLNAAHIALLASAGCESVQVFKKTRVALISTGDELKQPGEDLGYGDLYDSNRPAVQQMLNNLNVEIVDYGTLPDQPDQFRKAFLKADEECDFVITSGGVSVGEADFTKDILEELGEIDFWKLAIKPGKPFAFGKLSNSYFIGLPGNPVSAMVTFHILGSQAIRQHQGVGYKPMAKISATTQQSFKKSAGRQDFQRGYVEFTEEGAQVRSVSMQGSHILTGLAGANCYVVLGIDETEIEAGEAVEVWLFDSVI